MYVLRGKAKDPTTYNTIFDICNTISESVLNCEIVDNLGNVSGFRKESNYNNVTRDYVTTNKLSYSDHGGSGRSQQLMGYRNDYKPKYFGGFPIGNLSRSGTRSFYFWMNAVKPTVGEKLYETKLFLMYSVDEISKISKIEIRPKKIETGIGMNNKLDGNFSNDLTEVAKCIVIYDDKKKSDEERSDALNKAYNLVQKMKENPERHKIAGFDMIVKKVETDHQNAKR